MLSTADKTWFRYSPKSHVSLTQAENSFLKHWTVKLTIIMAFLYNPSPSNFPIPRSHQVYTAGR